MNNVTTSDINNVMENAMQAFLIYRKFSLQQRANFLRTIAKEIEAIGDELLIVAGKESNLPEARLRGERGRTIFQLNSYADACEKANWLEARIDTAIPDKAPPKPDIRKMLVPIGPVVVFGASNFPYAFSTAGGDTASALAAGCPVVVKAHPAHLRTGELVANAVIKAAKICNMPEGIFANVYAPGFEIGKNLVMHPNTKAVGFTGSHAGGKQLFDWANQRTSPIPVFAEMGSVNPVFLLPEKLSQSAEEIGKMYAGSITLGGGQFCTNPGIIIGIEGADLNTFIDTVATEIKAITPGKMLHTGIAKNYAEHKTASLNQQEVVTVATSEITAEENQGAPTIAKTTGKAFLANPVLHKEVFGPYSLIVECKDAAELFEVAKSMEGQLTSTIMATEKDLVESQELVHFIETICGRLIINSVPTGVEVCLSMQHGGPFPASTDSRFTSVGADAIKRFARPIAFQNYPESFLPDELKSDNPLQIWRTVNNEMTKEKL
jgi:2,5-dioxopentanoate dehydrogenase